MIRDYEQLAILSTVIGLNKNACVYLFGSRVDDTQKGRDIDLVVMSDSLTSADKSSVNRPVAEETCKMTTQLFDNGLVAGVSNPVPGTALQLFDMLNTIADLELAILIGSRATGTAHPDSDWDIAIQWNRGIDFVQQLTATEELRRTLAGKLGVSEHAVDLIDLPTTRLTMRAVVAEEGKPLKGGDSLAWYHFLQRTWRELEEQYWEQTYAA